MRFNFLDFTCELPSETCRSVGDRLAALLESIGVREARCSVNVAILRECGGGQRCKPGYPCVQLCPEADRDWLFHGLTGILINLLACSVERPCKLRYIDGLAVLLALSALGEDVHEVNPNEAQLKIIDMIGDVFVQGPVLLRAHGAAHKLEEHLKALMVYFSSRELRVANASMLASKLGLNSRGTLSWSDALQVLRVAC